MTSQTAFRGAVSLATALAALFALATASQPSRAAGTPLVKVTPRELLLGKPVTALAADAGRAAFVFCGELVGVWRPGATGIAQVGPGGQWTCPAPLPWTTRSTLSLALAGSRVAWVDAGGGNQVSYSLRLASASQPGAITDLTQSVRLIGAPDPDPARMGDVLGQGGLLVFSSRIKCGDGGMPSAGCQDPPPIVSQTTWRILGPSSKSWSCLQEQQACTKLASANGVLEPLSVDSGRVLLRRGDGTLVVRDGEGRLVRQFQGLAGLGPAAELMGNQLVVLVRGEVFAYSLDNGRRGFVRNVPLVPFDGVCGLPPCVPVPLQLLDAARGLVAYRLSGKLHLLGLGSGEDKVVASAADARFGVNGLFYSYTAAGAWPGRIRFVPWNALPVRPGP
ncbi:MAG: hypothetical protein ACXVZP_07320 [Gaiellaceae bacterium]